jgi:hypothetical protein
MAKGFGIAALVLAILSVFAAYGFNFFSIWIAMLCASVAALNGERAFTISSIIIGLAGLLLFSPITMGVIAINLNGGHDGVAILGFAPFLLPIAALVADVARKSESQRQRQIVIGAGAFGALLVLALVYSLDAQPTQTPGQLASSEFTSMFGHAPPGQSTQPAQPNPIVPPTHSPPVQNAAQDNSHPSFNACGFELSPPMFAKWQARQKTTRIGCPLGAEGVATVSFNGTTGRWVGLSGGDGNFLVLHTSGPHAGTVYHVQGCIYGLYAKLGGTGSVLGFPIGDEHDAPGGLQEEFEGGSVYWSAATRQCSIVKKADTVQQQTSGGSASQAPAISIQSAIFGSPGQGRTCVATQVVSNMCNGKTSCSLNATNDLCGDPNYGVAKELSVKYACGTADAATQSVQENGTLQLECQH